MTPNALTHLDPDDETPTRAANLPAVETPSTPNLPKQTGLIPFKIRRGARASMLAVSDVGVRHDALQNPRIPPDLLR